ncbi:hypothetical protein ABIX24_004421 [Escherichia albertii]
MCISPLDWRRRLWLSMPPATGMEARQGGDSSAGSVHDSPPRQGDARERHRQENNRTDSNQGRRKKRIITGKVM